MCKLNFTCRDWLFDDTVKYLCWNMERTAMV